MCKKPEQYEQIKFADPVSLGLGRNYAKPGQVLGLCGLYMVYVELLNVYMIILTRSSLWYPRMFP